MHPSYQPLPRASNISRDDDTEVSSVFSTSYRHPQFNTKPLTLHLTLIIISLTLLLTNTFWALHFLGYLHTHSILPATMDPSTQTPPQSPSSKYNCQHLHPNPQNWTTPFSLPTKTLTNPLWRALFPKNQGIVYLQPHNAPSPPNIFQNLPLPPSIPAPNTPSKSVYFVAAYHQLHCLTVLRSALYKLKENEEVEDGKWQHALHCLDSVRQSVMCNADSTLLATRDGKVFGDGQVRMCADWGALEAWVGLLEG